MRICISLDQKKPFQSLRSEGLTFAVSIIYLRSHSLFLSLKASLTSRPSCYASLCWRRCSSLNRWGSSTRCSCSSRLACSPSCRWPSRSWGCRCSCTCRSLSSNRRLTRSSSCRTRSPPSGTCSRPCRSRSRLRSVSYTHVTLPTICRGLA